MARLEPGSDCAWKAPNNAKTFMHLAAKIIEVIQGWPVF
jgi:hypothetical protein